MLTLARRVVEHDPTIKPKKERLIDSNWELVVEFSPCSLSDDLRQDTEFLHPPFALDPAFRFVEDLAVHLLIIPYPRPRHIH